MNNLIWFRNNLRVHDNGSLLKACQGEKAIAAYFFDPRYFDFDEFGFKRTERYRAKFLIETVEALRENLKKLNTPFFVFHGFPEVVLPDLVREHEINNIFLQKEWTRDENEVLEKTKKGLPAKTKFFENYDQFLFHPEDIPYTDFNSIPEIFTNFRKKCEKYCKVRPFEEKPSPLPESNLFDTKTKLPTLPQLGLQEFEVDTRTAFPFQGGENQGLKRIEKYFWETKKLGYYKRTRNGLIGKDYSSKLSAWLANGSISAKTVYWQVKRFEKEIIKNQDTYWLIFELIWRDYFKYISLKHGDKIFHLSGILNKEYDWKTSEATKNKWIAGTTEEPFVNANMKEIAKTGWMSNRGRQNVASFWAKELKQDWRIGAAYFESMLIDYDVHSNWGNWMYQSGVGNDPRDRKFNIKRQAGIYDAGGEFQNLWLQETLF